MGKKKVVVEPTEVVLEVRVGKFYQASSWGRQSENLFADKQGAIDDGMRKIAIGEWGDFIIYETWKRVDKRGRYYPKV